MLSKRQKIITIAIGVLVVISGLSFLMLHSSSPETPSKAMILKATDIGPGWQAGEEMNHTYDYPGVTSNSRWWYWMGNNTSNPSSDFDITLLTFNSSANCLAAFEQLNSTLYKRAEMLEINYTIVSIGDQGIFVDDGFLPCYMFMRGTVICWVVDTNGSYEIGHDQWWTITMLNIAHLQLYKIDQY
jgi:hypothetical protein